MIKRLFSLGFVLMLALVVTRADGRPVLVVRAFSVANGISWPYDAKQLESQTSVELKIKDGQSFEVITEAPKQDTGAVYTLEGEVLEWHAGNKAERVLVGMGSGREAAKIHYWLTDKYGKKVFEHTDIIRAAFWGDAYENSVGQLAQPFADKIAGRLKDAKLVADASSAPPVTMQQPTPQQSTDDKAEAVNTTGTVIVSSVPDGAEVYVDASLVGGLPATLKLAPGKHTIRVAMTGYKD